MDPKVELTPEQAALLLLRRNAMRESLIGFSQCIDIPNAPMRREEEQAAFNEALREGGDIGVGVTAHHRLLMEKIQECMETRYGRLMVFMPPGGAKSTYCSVVGPAWYMGKYPGSQIILASYGTDLAKKHGSRGRQVVTQQAYEDVFDATISSSTGAKEMWALTNGSEYMSGGLLSGITGNRANGVILDDPIKGRKDAESKTVRDATFAAIEDDLQTRYIPGAWMILVQTRWHDEDVAGALLPEDYDGRSGRILCRDGMEWEVVNLVAKIETELQEKYDPLGRKMGEYIWPEWFDRNHWRIYEPREGDPNSPSERRWAALFQQQPRPDHGNQFEREWVQWYDLGEHPKYLNFYTASDYSVSDGEGDFTEHGVAGLDKHGDLWLVDWWYGRHPPDITIDALLRLAKRWRAISGFDEKGLIEKAIKPQFEMRQRQLDIYLPTEYLPTIGDKVARFQSFRGIASAGKLHVPRCPWGERLVDQLCVFPGRSHDDAVDVCSLFGRGLEEMIWSEDPPLPPEPEKLQFGSWKWLTHGTDWGVEKKEPRYL
jgi:predicted phage terminase large subunit-like protein